MNHARNEAYKDVEHPERIKAELDRYERLIVEMTEKGYHKEAAELRRANKKMRSFYDLIGLGPELRKLDIEEQDQYHSTRSTAASRFVKRQISEEKAKIEAGEKIQRLHEKMVRFAPLFLAGFVTLCSLPIGRFSDPIYWYGLLAIWAMCGILYWLLKVFY